ncbi:MAG: hypothetical protein ACPKPY_09150 [Nitrososphaeraceae archaeon]
MRNNLSLMGLFSTLTILVTLPTLTSIYAQQENQTAIEIKFFAIQHSQSGSITEINATAYALELTDVSDKTILFSDRPDRIVTYASTSDFIGNWTVGENSFAVDPPNAVLVIDEIEGYQDAAIMEVFNPVYDTDKKTLNYEVTPDNTTSIELPDEFGQTTMVIDAVGPGGVPPWEG